MLLERRRPPAILLSLLFAASLVAVATPAHAVDKMRVVPMSDYFHEETPLTYTPGRSTPAVTETTIRHQVFFSDIDNLPPGWGLVDFRQGQPNAWHLVTGGTHACVGTSWWMGQPALPHGDGYDNNWVQSLTTNVPINLAGTHGNDLTFKSKFQSELDFDYGWVLIKGSNLGSRWDTLASFTGDIYSSCTNVTLAIPDSFATVTQPVTLQFLFGSDMNISASDSTGTFSGWTIDDVQVKSTGNPPGGAVRFFDDMEAGGAKWIALSPDPGTLWHLETAPSISGTCSKFFINTQLWVPFAGSGYGIVPDHADAMLTTPTMDLTGVFSPVTPTTALHLQFDDWENIPGVNGLYWSLWVRGSSDKVTWTPWRPALSLAFQSLVTQCREGVSIDFNPYQTSQTYIPPGTPYIQLGFRIRDEKALNFESGGPIYLGVNTEGIYFDNIGVYYIYTISGVEPVGGVPVGTRAAIRRVYPNPFNPSATVEFSIPKQGPVAVRVYDLLGRQVSTLAEGSLPAGTYRVKWDGRDRQGRGAASGVYFATIENAGVRKSVRMTLLK